MSTHCGKSIGSLPPTRTDQSPHRGPRVVGGNLHHQSLRPLCPLSPCSPTPSNPVNPSVRSAGLCAKPIAMPNARSRFDVRLWPRLVRISGFGFRISFGFRPSAFGFFSPVVPRQTQSNHKPILHQLQNLEHHSRFLSLKALVNRIAKPRFGS